MSSLLKIESLPLELQEKILRNIPPVEMHSRLRAVCHRWRAIIDRRRNTLPRVPAKCTAVVMEFGEDRFIQFQFSTSERKRRIFVGHTLQSVRFSAQIVSCHDELSYSITVPTDELPRILRILQVTHLEIRLTHVPRCSEGVILSVLQFLSKNIGNLKLQELVIRSDDEQQWSLSTSCQLVLRGVEHLERAVFVNIEGFDWLGEWHSWSTLSDLSIRSSCPSVTQKLDVLAKAQRSRIPNFVFDVSSEHSTYHVDALQLCTFIKAWASSSSPWLFGMIAFNASYGIQKVRTFLNEQSNQRIALITTPSFVYQIPHVANPKKVMEIKLQISEAFDVKWIITLKH